MTAPPHIRAAALALLTLLPSCATEYAALNPIDRLARTLPPSAVYEVLFFPPASAPNRLIYDRDIPERLAPPQSSGAPSAQGLAIPVTDALLTCAWRTLFPSDPAGPPPSYQIRDADGGLYDIDQIQRVSNKDNIIAFTVKNHPPFTPDARAEDIPPPRPEDAALHYSVVIETRHILLPRAQSTTIELDIPLPVAPEALWNAIRDARDAAEKDALDALFAAAPPIAAAAPPAAALSPQLQYLDGKDNAWKYAALAYRKHTLPQGGALISARVGSNTIVKIIAPSDAPPAHEATARATMDAILQTHPTELTLSDGSAARIHSFGPPERAALYTDAQGRTWQHTHWTLPHDRKDAQLYQLPLPDGTLAIAALTETHRQKSHETHTQRLLDHIRITRAGTITQWIDYLRAPPAHSAPAPHPTITWNERTATLTIDAPPLTITLDKTTAQLSPRSHIAIQSAAPRAITHVIITPAPPAPSHITIAEHRAPTPRSDGQNQWNALLAHQPPFDSSPRQTTEDNAIAATAVLPSPRPADATRWTAHLKEQNTSMETFSAHFAALQEAVAIKDQKN
ncbi:MAG: hypothetical protein LBS82_05490 [Spirochaetaceae bacterium]|jgi:hypothetical protein|nr:hypothetical protein [Spirochaetaceae bacterium]